MALEYRALKLQTAPVAEPLSLSETKDHLRVDIGADDTLITNLIAAAREWTEQFTRRALIDQTWDAYYAAFPSTGDRNFEVPRPPLKSVDTFELTDSDGNTSAVASTKYDVDTDSEPGRIVLKFDELWPTDTLARSNPVHVQFTAGYGSSASDVPQPLRSAMKLLVGHWYENRESVVVGTTSANIEMTAKALLGPYRVVGMN